jgi:fructokinase
MRLGIDLGGTKIEAVVLDADGSVLWRRRVPTPQGDYRATLNAIQSLVLAAETGLSLPTSVGVATPGAPSPDTGLMRNCNSTCLNGMPLQQDLCELLQREVRMANDADCLTLSEASDGAGAGSRVVFGVILGTGVGGGICVDGRLLPGPNAITGEWGHNRFAGPRSPVEASPRPCYCGRVDCNETWLSGAGLAHSCRDLGGSALDARAVAQAAASGDAPAIAALDLYCEQLAFALAQVINVLDPHVIVIGGGLSRIERLYEEVPRRWGRHVFSDRVRTRLLPAQYGDASGVRGAAWLFPVGTSE